MVLTEKLLPEGTEEIEEKTGLLSRRNRPPRSLPTPIILHVNRFWIKQKSARNMRQQEENFVCLLADIRLKEKAGTHRTLVRIKEAEILTVPMCVTETNCPLGSLTNLEMIDVMVVKKEIEQIM
jgi:hypothetical protein